MNSLKNDNDEEMLPNITKLVTFFITLSHSGAATERMFSSINLNKTKCLIRLSTEVRSGLLLGKVDKIQEINLVIILMWNRD